MRLLVAILLLLPAPALAQSAADLFARARDLVAVRSAGSPPFRLTMSLTARDKDAPAAGKYELIWLGPDRWRESVELGDYAEVRTADARRVYVQRSVFGQPEPVYWLLRYADLRTALLLATEDKPGKPKNDKRGLCVKVDGPRTASEHVCFDSAGLPVRTLRARLTFSGSARLAGKSFPQSIAILRHDEDDDVLLQADLQSLEPLAPGSLPDISLPPQSVIVFNTCPDPQPARLVVSAPPVVPEAARIAGAFGTVAVYAVVGADGEPRRLQVVHSVNRNLDAAAVQTVRKWKYRPQSCDGQPVESEVVVNVPFILIRR